MFSRKCPVTFQTHVIQLLFFKEGALVGLDAEAPLTQHLRAAMAMSKPLVHFLRLRAPIAEQLRMEEALFRVDKARNWFIANERASPATVVMGISGKPDQLLHLDAVKRCAGRMGR